MKIINKVISVVIPVFNSEKTILEVLLAIVNQTSRKNIKEIIVINDGSTDLSETIIDEFIAEHSNDSINIMQVHQENAGVSVARNKGMEISTGKWIAFCDSDDLWFQDKLEHQIKIIEKIDLDILGGYVFNNTFSILGKKYQGTFKPSQTEMLLRFFPWSSGIIMKKEIYNQVGGFEEGRNHGEDMLYYLDLMNMYKFYFDTRQIVSIGFGKKPFGESGLSSNLAKMYEGNINILDHLRMQKRLSGMQYYIFKFYYFLKHLRRIIISYLNNKN